jgi:hypothetical protein
MGCRSSAGGPHLPALDNTPARLDASAVPHHDRGVRVVQATRATVRALSAARTVLQGADDHDGGQHRKLSAGLAAATVLHAAVPLRGCRAGAQRREAVARGGAVVAPTLEAHSCVRIHAVHACYCGTGAPPVENVWHAAQFSGRSTARVGGAPRRFRNRARWRALMRPLASQFAYYMHRPAPPLHDVGFELLPVRPSSAAY